MNSSVVLETLVEGIADKHRVGDIVRRAEPGPTLNGVLGAQRPPCHGLTGNHTYTGSIPVGRMTLKAQYLA